MSSRASLKVTDRDKGWQKIVDELKRASGGDAYVKVGLLGGAKDRRPGEPVGNVELGVIHEFGAPAEKIPERSFLRRSFDAHKPEYLELLKKLAHGVYGGKLTLDRALGLVGAKVSSDVKATVTQGEPIPPPNSPRTLARKEAKSSGAAGPVRTLVDTGRMIGSIAWLVVMGGKASKEE